MPAFCFHSVRPRLAIPPASAWPSEKAHAGFYDHMTVEPGWFIEWARCAQEEWGDDLHITFDDGFRDVLVPAVWAVQRQKIATTVFVPTAHMGQVFPGTPYDVMDGSEVAYLSGQGVNIGSHSHRHEDHRFLYEPTLEAHCDMSAMILQGCTGKRPKDFAPPYGQFGPELVYAASRVGYERFWGTIVFPVGIYNTHVRWLANMDGYVNETGQENPWPWET